MINIANYNKKIFCNDTNESVYGYSNYLKTKHWKQLRIKVAKDRCNSCERCGVKVFKGFEIHHLTYKNIGHEELRDLRFLCGECHKSTHMVLNIRKPKRPIHVKASSAKESIKKTNDKPHKRIINVIE